MINYYQMLKKLLIFSKAQVSAFIGGFTDYLTMIFLTEFFRIPYVFSIAVGGIIGAIINFNLNKNWTFYSKANPYKHRSWIQLGKFVSVVLNSIIMKSTGTYFFTTYWLIDYRISRIITDLIVSVAVNFMLQKHWVFKKVSQ